MSEAIIVAIISGGLAFLGTVITCAVTAEKSRNEMKTNIAVVKEQIEQLRKSVDKHNNFAQRLPVVEEQIKQINHRLDELEKE